MSNVSIESKKGNFKITNKLTYPEAVNEQLFNAIGAKMFVGLLPLEKQQKRNDISIVCNVRGLTPLTTIFSRPISKAIFLDVVSKLISQYKNCESNGMNPNNIDAAADRMFIDLSNGEFSCIYWPLVNNRAENPPYRFLKELPNNVNFVSDEDKSYITEYKGFFADVTVPFSMNRLQELVYKLMGIEARTEQTPFENDSSFGNASDSTPSEVMEYDPLSDSNATAPASAETPTFVTDAEEPQKPEVPVRYCTNCGTKNVHEFFFCTDCGTRLSPLPAPAETAYEQPMPQNAFSVDDADSRTVSVEAAMLFGYDPQTVEPIIEEKQNTMTEYDPFGVQTAEPIPNEPIADDEEITCRNEAYNEVSEVDNAPETETESVESVEQAEQAEAGLSDIITQPEATAVAPSAVVSAWASMLESNEEPIVEEPIVEEPIVEEPITENPAVVYPEQTIDLDYGSDKTVAFFGADSEKTVVLPKPPKFVKQLFVFRLRTGEKTAVNKPEFCIGKERRNCDFTVTENNAVSRRHLNVVTRDGRYFVIDLKSTNGTFIDDKEIEPNCEIEIFPEVRIRLADEEFVFFVEEVLA